MGRRLILAAIPGCAAILAASAVAAVTPRDLMSSALAAGKAQRSVHYVISGTAGTRALTIVGDAARDRGIQQITYRKNGQTGHVTVVVVANTGYVNGDVFTLENYMGFTAGKAKASAGNWLRVEHTHPWFPALSAAVRLGSTMDELKLSHTVESAGTTTFGGRQVQAIRTRYVRSGQPATDTLYVDTGTSPLPVAWTEQHGGDRVRTVFSRWNAPVHAPAPASSLLLR